MSSAKDLELDQMPIKVKAFEGEFVYICINIGVATGAAGRQSPHQ